MTMNRNNVCLSPHGGGGAGSGSADPTEATLRAALGDEQRDTIMSLFADAFRGQSRVLAGITLVAQFAITAAAVACAIGLFGADTTRGQILYATGFLWAMSAVGLIKTWFWMQIQRNRVLREVKRLELQVSRLADASARA